MIRRHLKTKTSHVSAQNNVSCSDRWILPLADFFQDSISSKTIFTDSHGRLFSLRIFRKLEKHVFFVKANRHEYCSCSFTREIIVDSRYRYSYSERLRENVNEMYSRNLEDQRKMLTVRD